MAEAARQAAAEARRMENELTRPPAFTIEFSDDFTHAPLNIALNNERERIKQRTLSSISGASQPAASADTGVLRSHEDDAIFRISEAADTEPSPEELPPLRLAGHTSTAATMRL